VVSKELHNTPYGTTSEPSEKAKVSMGEGWEGGGEGVVLVPQKKTLFAGCVLKGFFLLRACLLTSRLSVSLMT
jgi:hypothetical protein